MRAVAAAILAILLALPAAAQIAPLPDGHVAERDRRRFDQSEWGYLWYATTLPLEPEAREAAGVALKLVIASVSPTEEIERATPVQISPTCYRLDLRDLGFRPEDWQELVDRYPYDERERPLTMRADWITLELSDTRLNPTAYYKLALGGVVPKTRDEILKLLGVDNDPARNIPMIEGDSGVSVRKIRWLEDHAALRGFAFGTRDVLKLTNESDPLEHPLGDFKHDGEEWLIYRRKFSSETGEQGVLQWSFLANGQGQIVPAAPVALVEDKTTFRGMREVANPGSCITCHPGGPNLPRENVVREFLNSGVRLYADKESAKKAARLLSDFLKNVKRGQEDYELAVKLATGASGEAATKAFDDTINRYDEPLTLERAALEYNTTPARLKHVIALASSSGGILPARVVGLAHGRTIPRDQFEQVYLAARVELIRWAKRR